MSEIPVPPIQHIVARDTHDPDKWVSRLVEWHSSIGPFNYEPAHATFPFTFSGRLSLLGLLSSVRKRGNPLGQSSNAEVIELIWNYAKDRIVYPKTMPKLFVNVRRNLGIPVKPDIYYNDSGELIVSWLQPAKFLRLSDAQHRYVAAAIKVAVEDTDWSGAKVEIVDLSAPTGSKTRMLSVFRPDEEELPSDSDLLALLGRFARAHDTLREAEYVPPKRKKGPSAPLAPDLFD